MTLPGKKDWGLTSFSKMLGSFMVDSFASVVQGLKELDWQEPLNFACESIRRAVFTQSSEEQVDPPALEM
jgi:hypothetical protein